MYEDKLQFNKNRRINWFNFIQSDRSLSSEFNTWLKSCKYKIRSKNKLAYIFLKSKYGNKWIQFQRNKKNDEIIIARFDIWKHYKEC